MDTKYYDGTKILSTKDINGDTPEIYIVTSNRSAGKTTYFNRLLFNRWLNGKGEFLLLYRFDYETQDTPLKYFGDIGGLFFKGWSLQEENIAKGKIRRVIATHDSDEVGRVCGYSVSLSGADTVKKYSHLFKDVTSILMDEIQPENNHYLPTEITNFMSVHNSVARGNGKQSRYVPVYMLSNFMSMLNPYFVVLGVSERLKLDTKILRGEGWVVEQNINYSAQQALNNSVFNKAFKNARYAKVITERVYMDDNIAFIQKINQSCSYYFTLVCGNKKYGVRRVVGSNIIYVSKSVDTTFPLQVTVDIDSHDINVRLIGQNNSYIKLMRQYFNAGLLRFQDLECKSAVLHCLRY
ncbi:MAG: phage DNA encapsidation protein [Muribaculaceae bacterium]|nr:phage DNA encapsidation protein [Muribaculaceae bacterium]MCM1511414.1 phage DNA encapsidation protein [Clostridium sp.]